MRVDLKQPAATVCCLTRWCSQCLLACCPATPEPSRVGQTTGREPETAPSSTSPPAEQTGQYIYTTQAVEVCVCEELSSPECLRSSAACCGLSVSPPPSPPPASGHGVCVRSRRCCCLPPGWSPCHGAMTRGTVVRHTPLGCTSQRGSTSDGRHTAAGSRQTCSQHRPRAAQSDSYQLREAQSGSERLTPAQSSSHRLRAAQSSSHRLIPAQSGSHRLRAAHTGSSSITLFQTDLNRLKLVQTCCKELKPAQTSANRCKPVLICHTFSRSDWIKPVLA